MSEMEEIFEGKDTGT